ncbi:MAG: hypothetical protein JST19_16290 [Bacteroidetes bacterium]|nr:hypothetical protein [Bacteroidota bacterium]
MFIRFITEFVNESGDTQTGIFNALAFIRDHHGTQDDDCYKLKLLTGWFNTYLEKPDRLSKAKSKNPAAISLSWFKDSAKSHIDKMRELEKILSSYGLIVDTVTTKNPGYIVYEDDYQISAIPFKGDAKKVL